MFRAVVSAVVSYSCSIPCALANVVVCSAVLPFVTGTLLNYEGLKVLTYILVGQTAALGAIWFFLPSRK